jgi:hypothetical protein
VQLIRQTPAFLEVKMDAEINAYQEDVGRKEPVPS